MLVQAWSYALLLFVDIGLLIAQLYFIIAFTDLESDYLNPMELCESMDRYYPPEAFVQAGVSIWLLLIGEWKSVVLTIPVTLWNLRKWMLTGFKFDATTIFRSVRRHRIESFVKLIYYFMMFCYFLYCMIWYMVAYSDSDM